MTRRNRSKSALVRGDTGVRSPSKNAQTDHVVRAVVIVVAVKVAGLVLLFDTASSQAFDGPKSAFSLASTWVLLGLIAIAVMQQGVGSLGRTRMHIPVTAFWVANVLAVIFAEDRYIAMFGADRRLGLTFAFDMVVLYTAVALACRTSKDWTILAGAVAAAGLATMMYGVVQYVGWDPIPWVQDVRVRPSSTFGNADKFGHFVGATFAVGATMAILPLNLSRRIRLLAAMYAFTAFGAAAIIATRGALLGSVAALAVGGVVYVRLAGSSMDRRRTILVTSATLSLAIISGTLLAVTPLGQRIRAGFADSGLQQRVYLAEAALGAFRDRPLTGYGPDSFGILYPRYRPPRSVDSGILVNQDSAHSWLLQAAATTGAFGTIALASVPLFTFVVLWRRLRTSPQIAAPLLAGAVAYWVQGLVTIGSVSVDWMGWLAAGAAGALSTGVRTARVRRIPAVLQAAVLGAVAALVISGYSAIQANRDLKAAQAAMTFKRADRAIPFAEHAVRLDPGRAEHWFALGRARQDRQMWPEAAEALREATDRAPHLSEYWSNLALSLTNLARAGDRSMGGKEAALAAARRGTEVNPYYSTPRHVLAVVANSFGEYSEALDAASAAIRLLKGEPLYEMAAAEAALGLQDSLAARSGLERLVTEKDSAVLRVALARISLKLNDSAAARVHLRRALELDPQNAPARELLGQLVP